MANIVLLTQGTGGDLFPFVQLGVNLKARGHKVSLISNYYFEEEVRRCGLDFAPLLPQSQAKELEDGSTTGRGNPEYLGPLVFSACVHVYDGIKRLCGSAETLLVSHSNLSFIAQMAAEKLELPYVNVYTAPYFVMRLPLAERALNAEKDVINFYRAKLNLQPVFDWGAWLKAPRWKIGLWPEWFAPNDPKWMLEVSPVGFVWSRDFEMGEVPEEVKALSAKGEAPVLITHGTSKPYRREFFTAAIYACMALGRPGILVTKDDEMVPSRLPRDIKRYRYLPFASVLPLMGAIVHHGGIGTLNRTLAAGVPQLVLAYGYDRPDNGSRIQRLGVGEWLPAHRWEPESATASLSRVLAPEVKQRCRDLANQERNSVDPVTAASAIIELAVAQSALQLAEA